MINSYVLLCGSFCMAISEAEDYDDPHNNQRVMQCASNRSYGDRQVNRLVKAYNSQIFFILLDFLSIMGIILSCKNNYSTNVV